VLTAKVTAANKATLRFVDFFLEINILKIVIDRYSEKFDCTGILECKKMSD
jgi:hypothetical protein